MAKRRNSTIEGRLASGACYACGADTLDSGLSRCEPCREALKQRDKARKDARRALGLCVNCDDQAIAGRSRCQRHLARSTGYTLTFQKKRSEKGTCCKCDGDVLPSLKSAPERLCETCYLKKTARRYLGSNRRWRDLLSLLEGQRWRCAYTGEILVLGVNDSVDHSYPVSAYPDLAGEITNLEWITREINVMKRDRTPEQFMALMASILSYRSNTGLQAPSQRIAA
jgi:hypothetical protein